MTKQRLERRSTIQRTLLLSAIRSLFLVGYLTLVGEIFNKALSIYSIKSVYPPSAIR